MEKTRGKNDEIKRKADLYPYAGEYQSLITGEKYTFHFRKSVPFTIRVMIVKNVVEAVYPDQGGYRPYMEGVMLLRGIIAAYTDIRFPEGKDSLDIFVEFLETTNIAAKGLEALSKNELDDIKIWVKKCLDERKGERSFDKICEALLPLVTKGTAEIAKAAAQAAQEKAKKEDSMKQEG